MMKRKRNWKNYVFEFLSIFIGVSLAFALNNWNDNRRDRISEDKILKEIKNGLELDLKDIQVNMSGHRYGIRACEKFRKLIDNQPVDQDSIQLYYAVLVRDFTSIMNLSGYESLKSKGLEIVKNDSLRYQIIATYDFYYELILKLEEKAVEMQSFQNYFMPINELLYEFMAFSEDGELLEIQQPLDLQEKQKKKILSYLWRIQKNRKFKLNRYDLIKQKVKELIEHIDHELSQ